MITVSPSDMHSTATHAYNNGLPSVTHAPVNSRTTQQITTTKPHQSPQTMLHNELTVLKVDEQRQRAFTLPVTATVLDVSVQLTADGQIKIRLSSVCTLQFKGFIYTKINSYYSHEKKSSQMLLAIILVNNAIKCLLPKPQTPNLIKPPNAITSLQKPGSHRPGVQAAHPDCKLSSGPTIKFPQLIKFREKSLRATEPKVS